MKLADKIDGHNDVSQINELMCTFSFMHMYDYRLVQCSAANSTIYNLTDIIP